MNHLQCLIGLFLFITLALKTSAQPAREALAQMIAAERAFAQLSEQQGTRVAFLAHLSATSALYSQGEVINGMELWQKTPADSALLKWWPVYADVSQAGDLGYTTGPFQYFKTRNDQIPVGTGYYSTVWRKEADGTWKVATDLGIGVREQAAFTENVQSPLSQGQRSDASQEKRVLESLESEYIARLNTGAVSYLQEYLADEFRIHRPSRMPCTSLGQLASLDEQQRKFTFGRTGLGIASSGDLAFTYGKVKIETHRDGHVRSLATNYMRVWKRLNGSWKVVLDVIG